MTMRAQLRCRSQQSRGPWHWHQHHTNCGRGQEVADTGRSELQVLWRKKAGCGCYGIKWL